MLLLFFVGNPEVGDPKNGIPYGSPRAHIYARVSDFLVAPDCTTVHFRLIFVSYCSFSTQICLIAVHFSSCVPSVASQQSWSGTAVHFGCTAAQFDCTTVQFGCTPVEPHDVNSHAGIFHERPPHEKKEAAFFHERPPQKKKEAAFFSRAARIFLSQALGHFLLTLHHSPKNTVYQLSSLHLPPSTFHPTLPSRCNQKCTHARATHARA